MSKPGRHWVRIHSSIRENVKLHSLSPQQRWDWLMLLTITGEEGRGGRLPPNHHVAFLLRMPLANWVSLADLLLSEGLLDRVNGGVNGWEYAMHDWADWQYESDTSTQRTRAFRERSSRARVSEQSRAEKESSKESAGQNEGEVVLNEAMLDPATNLPADLLERLRGWAPQSWVAAIDMCRRECKWLAKSFGPPPGEPNCLVPASLVTPSLIEDARRWDRDDEDRD